MKKKKREGRRKRKYEEREGVRENEVEEECLDNEKRSTK